MARNLITHGEMNAHWKIRLLGPLALCLAAAAGPACAQMTDPTRPTPWVGTHAAPVVRGPVLETVLVSPLRRQAVISGRLVRVGDEVAGSRVLRIATDGVEMERAGHTTWLLLPSAGRRPGAPAEAGGGS